MYINIYECHTDIAMTISIKFFCYLRSVRRDDFVRLVQLVQRTTAHSILHTVNILVNLVDGAGCNKTKSTSYILYIERERDILYIDSMQIANMRLT